MSYTTRANLEAFLGRELSAAELTLMNSFIEYISQFVATHTNRSWNSITAEWSNGDSYEIGDLSELNDIIYECTVNHTADPDNQPGVGDDWETYWELADTAESRVYDGNGHRELEVDDFTSLVHVKLLGADGTSFETIDSLDDYMLLPHNQTVKNSIYLRYNGFPERVGSVEVRAIFGSGAVPEGVVTVTTQLVARLFTNAGKEAQGRIRSKRLGEYSVSYEEIDGILKLTRTEIEMLDQFRRIQI